MDIMFHKPGKMVVFPKIIHDDYILFCGYLTVVIPFFICLCDMT